MQAETPAAPETTRESVTRLALRLAAASVNQSQCMGDAVKPLQQRMLKLFG